MALSVTHKPHYEVWGSIWPHFVVSNSRMLDTPLPGLWDELRYHLSTAEWSACTTIQSRLV